MVRKTYLALAAILVVGAVLRLWNLAGPDMATDDALYSFRAVGYFDWAASLDTQTTPVVWFERPVWWQKLSFHDAPPLVFAFQWLFFGTLGINLWAARLPFVLAGLLSIFGIYLLGKLIGGVRVGLLAATILAVANYHVWISRIGFLDGFLIPWIIFSLYFFIQAREKPTSYLWWGVFCGLGILTKYTFLFMGPVFLIAILVWRRSDLRQKWLYLGISVFLIFITPVAVYNVMMLATRGHFDAALSTLLGDSPNDFFILTRGIKQGFSLENVFGVLSVTARQLSLAMRILAAAALAFFTGILVAGRSGGFKKHDLGLLGLGMVWAVIMVSFIGPNSRFAVVLLPFLAVAVGIAVVQLAKLAVRPLKVAAAVILALALVWEIIFSAQSQLIPEPILKNGMLLAASRPQWAGYSELETYVTDFYNTYQNPSYIVFSVTPQIRAYKMKYIKSLYGRGEHRPQQDRLLVYDDRMEWFATVWIFERRRLYDAAAIPSLTNFVQAIDEGYYDEFVRLGFKEATIIIADASLQNETNENAPRLEEFVATLMQRERPIAEIRNARGEIAFRVFRLLIDGRLKAFKKNDKMSTDDVL